MISVIIVTVFGFIGTAGYPFVITYLITYVVYLVASILVEKKEQKGEQNMED